MTVDYLAEESMKLRDELNEKSDQIKTLENEISQLKST